MSDVLRKKIRSATGVPRTVLQMSAFWENLRAVCSDWTLEIFGVETRALFESRRVISGKAVREMIGTGAHYIYASDGSSGLAAILLEADCANVYVARRMQDSIESAASASLLFVRLICEDAAGALRMRIAKAFDGLRTAQVLTPAEDYRNVAGLLDPSSRYLHVGMRFPLPEQSVQLMLVFALDEIMHLSARQSKAASDRLASIYRQTPETLRRSVRTSAISIDAVIDRMKMSIGDCSRLEVDQIIVLNAGAREQVTLTAETMSGALDFGKGRMGVWKNNRAVQVSAPVSPAFLENIADLDHRAFAP